MAVLLFIITLFLADEAYAFNSLMFMDPDFLAFIFIKLPIIGGILISLWEGTVFRKILKEQYGWKQAFIGTLLGNIWSLLFYVILAIIVMNFTREELMKAPHPVVIWVGIDYFALMFIYFSGKKKLKMIKKIAKQPVKALTIKVYLVNTISYICIYAYLYETLY